LTIFNQIQVIVDMIGLRQSDLLLSLLTNQCSFFSPLEYNPRYFSEPEEYRPSRWYGLANDSEAFSAFSVGARACIGRKFATVEVVAFLTLLLREWKVEPIFREGETKEAWRRRVLDANIIFTLGVKDVPIRLTRRERLARQ
jgi:hypothetical protein